MGADQWYAGVYRILAQEKGKGYTGMAGNPADISFCRADKDFVCIPKLPAVLAGVPGAVPYQQPEYDRLYRFCHRKLV